MSQEATQPQPKAASAARVGRAIQAPAPRFVESGERRFNVVHDISFVFNRTHPLGWVPYLLTPSTPLANDAFQNVAAATIPRRATISSGPGLAPDPPWTQDAKSLRRPPAERR
jgi:hypothetical protein